MHPISMGFEFCRAGMVTLERRAVGVEGITVRLDYNSLCRPEKVDQVTPDHDVYLRQRKAGSPTESEKIDLER